MKTAAALICSAIVVLAAATLSAHLITFKGTVVEVEKEAVKVNVVDPESKKITLRTFFIGAETKVLRGDVVVKFAAAKIQKSENITVTVDHDLDEDLAYIIRLGAAKK